jgi:hypothetical protein
MIRSTDPDAQAVCDRQKAWNSTYYKFFKGYQQTALDLGQLLPRMLDEIADLVSAGRTVEAITLIGEYRELLAGSSSQDAKMVLKHHEYVEQAMGNYKAMAEVLRDYSLARDDQDFAGFAATQIAGIDHFWFAPIADLDPERA